MVLIRKIWNKILDIFRYLSAMNIGLYAANAGYFLVLSIFPMLVLVISILRYTPFDVHNLISLLAGVLPNALLPKAEHLILNTYHSTSGAVVGLSALTALWSASRGIYSLLSGMNAVYGVKEDRSYLRVRLIGVFYTVLFIAVLLLTLVLHVFGNALVDLLQRSSVPILQLLTNIVDLRFFLLLFLQTALFTAMFMTFPNRRNTLGTSLPGALLSAIGWTVFSQLFSYYVENFPYYSNIYGSVYAFALSMLWLYACLLILFYGGVLNRLLIPKDQ